MRCESCGNNNHQVRLEWLKFGIGEIALTGRVFTLPRIRWPVRGFGDVHVIVE
jgi:hypothetical protein